MRNRVLVVLALLLLPAAVSAQGLRRGEGRMGGPGGGRGPMNPAQVLLDHRGDLDLSDEQVATLEGYAKQWTASHEAMRASMDSARGSGGMREMTAEQREQMRALREAMMANSRKLHEEIRATLTTGQLEQAARFLPPQGRGRRGMMGERAGRGPRTAALRAAPRTGPGWRVGPRAGAVRRAVVVRPVRGLRPAFRPLRGLRPAFRPLGVRRAIRRTD